eukprot:CAMPEP_0183412508 /NCGR_PEP_ID=MMETSP0370-20130417/21069_1 /TAXON_ID=268820 /ORGANISM="Peridinium aciculiferum, Strain PAER-2" /LENGTH=32 /DNA_ID= /DNA_START= /DNA_END= /DNA_ORIENTATION=
MHSVARALVPSLRLAVVESRLHALNGFRGVET